MIPGPGVWRYLHCRLLCDADVEDNEVGFFYYYIFFNSGFI